MFEPYQFARDGLLGRLGAGGMGQATIGPADVTYVQWGGPTGLP
jgi:hypothetical protein